MEPSKYATAELRAQSATAAAIARCEFARTFGPYLGPIVDVGTAKDIDAAHSDWRPVYDALIADATERHAIETNPDLTPDGRDRGLASLRDRRLATAGKVLPSVVKISNDVDARILSLEAATDLGMREETHGGVRGFVKTIPDPTAEQIALAAEFRAAMRTLAAANPGEFSIRYRQFVADDDPRARWSEADPAGGLVGPQLRAWAREYRIENSPLQPQMKILHAKARSYRLLLESAIRGFGLHAAEIERMTAA
jgi:hypothetical protein